VGGYVGSRGGYTDRDNMENTIGLTRIVVKCCFGLGFVVFCVGCCILHCSFFAE